MTSTLVIPGDIQQVSDGEYSFEDLHRHRHLLFLMLLSLQPSKGWLSMHNPEPTLVFFVAGFQTSAGEVTAALPEDLWALALCTGARVGEPGLPHTTDPDDFLSFLARAITQGPFVRNSTDSPSVEILVADGGQN